MKKAISTLVAVTAVALPLMAGSMFLEVSNPGAEPEASAKHALVVGRITACHAPEKTTISATAEGLNGSETGSPLRVEQLSNPSKFTVVQAAPVSGRWIMKVIATNPEYRGYTTGVLVPVNGNEANWKRAKQFSHNPTPAEISAMMGAAAEDE